MRLQLQGVVETGVSLLDNGITDIKARVIDGDVQIFASTGRNGGIASFELDAQGSASVSTTVIFPPSIQLSVDEKLVLSDDGAVVFIGGNENGLIGYQIDGDGLGTATQDNFQTLHSMAVNGDAGVTEAMLLLSEQTPDVFPTGVDGSQIVDLVSVEIDGQTIVLTADSQTDGVLAYRVDGATGALHQTDAVGADQGLGVNAPTAMGVVQVNGQSFVVLAAAGTSSISVMQVARDGSLVPTDHVIDNGSTRFEGVQDLAVAQSGDHAFVVAGGADNGLTLFMVLPNGSLLHLQTIADTDATSLHKVTAIETAIDGDTLHVFAGSQNEGGLTQFSIDLSSLGDLQIGTADVEVLTGDARSDILVAAGQGDTLDGRDGADVLVSGDGDTRMSGGNGADIFVFQEGSGTSHILDFEPGQDRIDLSDLPMLRDLAQLTITTTSSGAQIEYRGHVINVTSADGQPLTASDLFPNGLEGGDHFGFYPVDPVDPEDPADPPGPSPTRPGELPPDPELPPIEFTPRSYVGPGDGVDGGNTSGTDGAETLKGSGGDDTIEGLDGNDLIKGFGGHDWITAGSGDDKVLGGAGADTIYGDNGSDRLLGGGGNDFLSGGQGNDMLLGGDGNDYLFGNDGDDSMYGGNGNDVLYGGDGKNRIGLGAGDDWAQGGSGIDQIYSSSGNDTVFGGDGNDDMGGGPGDDYVSGGNGNDGLYGKAGNDWMEGGAGADTIWAGHGDDVINGGDGNDQLRGTRGNDSVYGDAGNDAIWGGYDDDLINGGAGDDWLSGGDGHDFLIGGAGDDVMRGGQGLDTFWGNEGADVFEFFGNHDTGWIMDFNPSEGDMLRLDDGMWAVLGALSSAQVVERFGSISDDGDLVLDFTEHGGSVIVLDGFTDIDSLANSIVFM